MSESINNIGIVASALSDDPRIAARSARAMGFRGVELDVATRSIDLTSLSQTGNRELRHVLASSDQTLIALRADWGANGAGPQADIDRLLSSMQRAMEAAKSLGAPMLCVDVGPLPEPAQAAPKTRAISPESAGAIYIPPPVSAPLPTASDVNPIDPAWMSSVDGALAAIGALSDRIGVIVAIRSELASFAAIERALVAAACIGIGVDFDPVAALRDA